LAWSKFLLGIKFRLHHSDIKDLISFIESTT
jgi:hypothetical protein